MRSSESANKMPISTCVPNVMRSGKIKKAAMASTQGSASMGLRRSRCASQTAARSRRAAGASATAAAGTATSLTAIKPSGAKHQDQHRRRVDEEAAGLRREIFAAGVDDAQDHCGQQRSLKAAEAPHRDHDEKQHQIDGG